MTHTAQLRTLAVCPIAEMDLSTFLWSVDKQSFIYMSGEETVIEDVKFFRAFVTCFCLLGGNRYFRCHVYVLVHFPQPHVVYNRT
jgi:hypothetical protein